MLIGYERVSTDDQNLALQQDALQAEGCEKIFSDKMSGAKADRLGLKNAFDFAREGDTLVVWRLDRLGRSLTSDPTRSGTSICEHLGISRPTYYRYINSDSNNS